ncbi:hypothetical protein EVAR_32717_1 [Eumeta japonica]|uniref:Uncharacterized protein n=1 Tax=Eumeta variegata TaxID=151549 RepID=A0A4C1ZAI2_EUMVA|nr:hypothetical protein EVAR_32717_1 [Eumeta japonica]
MEIADAERIYYFHVVPKKRTSDAIPLHITFPVRKFVEIVYSVYLSRECHRSGTGAAPGPAANARGLGGASATTASFKPETHCTDLKHRPDTSAGTRSGNLVTGSIAGCNFFWCRYGEGEFEVPEIGRRGEKEVPADPEMRQVPESRCDFVPEGPQEAVPVAGLPLSRLPARVGEAACNGCTAIPAYFTPQATIVSDPHQVENFCSVLLQMQILVLCQILLLLIEYRIICSGSRITFRQVALRRQQSAGAGSGGGDAAALAARKRAYRERLRCMQMARPYHLQHLQPMQSLIIR